MSIATEASNEQHRNRFESSFAKQLWATSSDREATAIPLSVRRIGGSSRSAWCSYLLRHSPARDGNDQSWSCDGTRCHYKGRRGRAHTWSRPRGDRSTGHHASFHRHPNLCSYQWLSQTVVLRHRRVCGEGSAARRDRNS